MYQGGQIGTHRRAVRPTSLWLPQDHGWSGWSYPPMDTPANQQCSPQGCTALVRCKPNVPITKAYVELSVIATAPVAGQCFMALYNPFTLALLGQSLDISAQLTTLGIVVAQFAAPVMPVQGMVRVLRWTNAGVQPSFSRSSVRVGTNYGLAIPRFSLGGSGALTTTAPNPLVLAASNVPMWCAVGP